MRNVKTEVKGNILTIKIKLDAKTKPSASGKTLIIGTTGGNKDIGEGVVLGVNCYKFPE